MPDLVIKNARLVLSDKIVQAGLVIEEGRIKQIVSDPKLPQADRVIDAHGNYVLPGLIDVHVHLREPGSSSKEDWITGTSAAAAGGVTTVLDMPNTQPPTTTIQTLSDKRAIAKPKAKVDYGFHFGASLDNLDELRRLEDDIASVKFYMSVTTGNLRVDNDAVIYEELKILAKKGILATTHAENRDMVQYWLEKLKQKENPTAVDYADYRPNICASTALNQLLYLSRKAGSRIHFCHVSTREEVNLLRKNKREGVTSEVTPHNLFLTKENIKELGNYSKVNPPLRSKQDQGTLWKAIRSGVIDVIATDHAPHLLEEKEKDILSASSGMPGLETLLPLLLNEVGKGTISLIELSKLTAGSPAKIFRIRGKGAIVEGYDADLVIVDLKKEAKVENEKLFTKCGWSPFDGWKLRGWPLKTFVRGNLVFDEGVIGDTLGKEITYTKNEE
ncbi:MAG: dihydroorotase family protein [Candidatus Altiarchaeota archaeon]|nr:dihydroorotase family protein [Candidatus Altiarchaeota archaeon]